MNIIIPMAGLGKRLRPHTLTVPKPLLPIAGKPIVHRLVEDIASVCPEKIENIGFIIQKRFKQMGSVGGHRYLLLVEKRGNV